MALMSGEDGRERGRRRIDDSLDESDTLINRSSTPNVTVREMAGPTPLLVLFVLILKSTRDLLSTGQIADLECFLLF